MKNILNIMRLDLTAMRAKRFSLGKAFLIMFVLSLVLGVLFPPLIIAFLFALSLTAVPAFIDIEDKNGGEMTFAVLPVTRKQNVIARYGLITIVQTVTGAVSFIVLKIAQILDISGMFRVTGELNSSLSDVLNLKINDYGIFALIVCLTLAYGLFYSALQLGGYFKRGKSSTKKSTARGVFILVLVYVAVAAVFIIEASSLNVQILHSALMVLATLFTALSAPFNGALLCIFALGCAYGFVFYKAACSVIDYESREL